MHQCLLLGGQLPLSLGHIRKTAGVVYAVGGNCPGRAVGHALSALDAHLLGKGLVKWEQVVGYDLSDHKKSAILGVDDHAAHTGKSQSGGKCTFPLRQGGHIRKSHEGSTEGLMQFLAGLIQDAANHNMIVRNPAYLQTLAPGCSPV